MKLKISMTNATAITIAEIEIRTLSAVNAGFYEKEKKSSHMISHNFEFSSPLTKL